jgi:hypothetical protein
MDDFEFPDDDISIDSLLASNDASDISSLLLNGDALYAAQKNLPEPLYTQRKVKERRLIEALHDNILDTIIVELPPPDTDLYIISNGRGQPYVKAKTNKEVAFEFGQLLGHLAKLLGKQLDVHISTWSMNLEHANLLLDLLDDKTFNTLSLLADISLPARKRPIFNTLYEGMLKRQQRIKLFVNHAKVCLMRAPDGRCVTVFSSANLSSLPRAENLTLSTDPTLHAFMRDSFFEAIFNA